MLGTCAMVGSVDECLCVADDSMEPLQMFTVRVEIFSLMRVVVCQRFAITPESICFYNRTSFQILIHKLFHGRNLNIGCDQHLQALLAALLRNHVFASVFRASSEAMVTENATRLALMQQAEQSVDEQLDAVQQDLSNVRQDEITNELMDIVIGHLA